MLDKKLLTAGSAIGILAMGACFLPPDRSPSHPLPPYLGSIQTIAVNVEDMTGESTMDSYTMSAATASSFNRLWAEYPVYAVPHRAGAHSDVVLHIVVTQKSLSRVRTAGNRELWEFQISTDSTLISNNGQLLWRRPNQAVHVTRWFSANAGTPPWKDHGVTQDVAYDLAMNSGAFLTNSTGVPQERQ